MKLTQVADLINSEIGKITQRKTNIYDYIRKLVSLHFPDHISVVAVQYIM